MSYDIYGNPLRRGHCEVHPHVHEEYPCSVCMTESRRHQEAQSPAQCNGNPAHFESAHYLGRAQEEITRLNDEIQALRKDAERMRDALTEAASELECLGSEIEDIYSENPTIVTTLPDPNVLPKIRSAMEQKK